MRIVNICYNRRQKDIFFKRGIKSKFDFFRMTPLWILLVVGFISHGSYGKPLEDNTLPHNRDYYAGYIRAITDNFDQLFVNERQVRSADEDDDDNQVNKTTSPVSSPLWIYSIKQWIKWIKYLGF